MRLRQKYLDVLSAILPAGVVGASLLLGATVPSRAEENPAGEASASAAPQRVSERLAAIREAAFVVIGPEASGRQTDPDVQLVWGNRWGNWGGLRRPGWGWGRPAWNNWRNGWPNWNNFWRNW